MVAEISVVVPCHNYGRFLRDAVHSLAGGETCLETHPGQSFESFEIVIVNDGSTDESESVIDALAKYDGRVRKVSQENRGTAAALNAGIRASVGEYIYILSADDMVEPWTLERALSAAKYNHRSVVYGDLQIVRGGKRDKVWRLSQFDFRKVALKNPIPCGGVLYPKECWRESGGYPEVMRHGREGWAFNVAWGLAGWVGCHIGQSGYLYRRDGQSRSESTAGAQSKREPPEGFLTWKSYYARQMYDMYPNLYNQFSNVELNAMGCAGCGSRRVKGARATPPAPAVAKPLAGRAGMKIVEYIGPSAGDQSYDVGMNHYVFGGVRKQGYVDTADLSMLLGMRGKQNEPLFREIVPKG